MAAECAKFCILRAKTFCLVLLHKLHKKRFDRERAGLEA